MSGLISRVKKKFLPEFIEPKSFEKYVLSNKLKKSDSLNLNDIVDLDSIDRVKLKEHIYQSIVLLSSKVTAIGLDKNIKYKLESLLIDVNIFSDLASKCSGIETQSTSELLKIISDIKTIFKQFRLHKNRFGTSIQLSYKTKLVSKYLERLRLLVKLNDNNNDTKVWKQLIHEYVNEYDNHRSIIKYCRYHFDLVLLQAVEHTAAKGEKYIAENKQEYLKFLKKSMLGGFIISLFAFAKLFFDTYKYPDLSSAFIFSLNYAVCFILVKKLGGIIATKQPAMTASTIAKYIDDDNDLKVDNIGGVIHIVKNTLRSQFISFVGNMSVA